MEFELASKLASFPLVSAEVLSMTVPRLSGEPVINLEHVVEVSGNDFIAGTRRSDDFFSVLAPTSEI